MSDVSVHLNPPNISPSPSSVASHDRFYWIGSVAISAILFGLLANQHWVPGGDSEAYLATARNILLHHFSMRGYLFNGQPINMFPPGWPYLLAAAMTISTRFVFLKSIVLLSMVGSLAMAYPICRRFAPPAVSAAAVVMTALTSHVFPLTFWLHSDAMFCLLTSACFLVALQIGEGKTSTYRIVLLCLLCFAAGSVRYAGPFNWLIICGALLQHQFRPIAKIFRDPTRRRYLAAVIATFLVTTATFVTWQAVLHVSAAEALLIKQAGGSEETAIDSKADKMVSHGYGLLNADQKGVKGYLVRPLLMGSWYSQLYWQPFRFGVVGWLNAVGLLFGWLVAIPVLALAIDEIKNGRPFWLSVFGYTAALAIFWTHPVARYFVPLTFLLLIGLCLGARGIGRHWRTIGPLMDAAMALFILGFVVCNGLLYGIEVWAQRASDFYARYEGGLDKDLIAACDWLVAHPLPADESIAVSKRYVNLSKTPKLSVLGLRVTTMLTCRPVVELPMRYMRVQPTTQGSSATKTPDYLQDPDPATSDFFLAWARQNGVKYFLYQPPVSPWRAMHFRVPWLQEHATHEAAIDTDAGWRLYEILPHGKAAKRILPLPASGDWPLRVPGI